uniref:Protocadherin 2 alpha a 15 n=1 Tax=Oncorhynchus tshawytscha TaxID=74940 RepID=A0A8C8FZL5_ONCTS
MQCCEPVYEFDDGVLFSLCLLEFLSAISFTKKGVFALIFFWIGASAQIRYSISEELKEGTVIGNVAKDLTIDLSTLKERGFRIVSGSNEPLFQLNQNDGILYVNRKIDREEVCERSTVCLVNLKTVLENPLEIHYVSVEVLDVNDHSPSFPEKEKRLEISESALPGARFQLQAARDPDGGIYSVQQYKLSQNDNFRIEVKDRGEDRKMPILILQKQLDRESAKNHRLLLTAIDGGKPARSGTIEIIVEVLDVNDNSPVFTKDVYSVMLGENSPVGATLQAARDPDGGIYSVQQYKLSQNDNFRIEVKDRGEDRKMPILILQKQLDRESAKNHRLLLTAIDGGKPARSGTIEIIVEVLDVNDNSPVFTKDVYSVMLGENSPVGATVIQVKATDLDEDANGEIIYSFGNGVDDKLLRLFGLDPNTGELTVKGLIDYEVNNIYDIDIQASDKGPVPLTTDKSVIVKIIDVNDNAPEIEVTSFSKAIPEDSRPGTTVALISVNDLDSGLNGKVLCSVMEDLPFKLMSSLQDNMYSVVTKLPLDREKVSQYDLTIVATDQGHPPLSSVKTISVVVSDVNDNSPEFSLSPYTFYVTENNEPGASVFSVSASDRDIDENAFISYHILRDSGEENKWASFLNLNSENGNIFALKSFDFETLKTFKFQVVATDSGIPSLSSNVTVNVFILDQNDNAPVILYPVIANGSAAGEVTDHSLFALDRYTGQIRTLRSFTETDETENKLVILVKDNGNVSLSATATVIINVVEPKEAFAASDVKSAVKDEEENSVTFYLIITLMSVSALFIISIIVLIVMQCSKAPDDSSKYLQDVNYDGTLCHSIQYRSGDKRYMLVGPRMSIGSTIAPGSNGNTLVVPDHRRSASGEVRSLKRPVQESPTDQCSAESLCMSLMMAYYSHYVC